MLSASICATASTSPIRRREAALVAGFDRIDGLVNAAGVTHRARVGEVALDDWNRVLAVNTTGPLLGIQAVLGRMPAGGSIVNVCSLAALTGHYTAAYTASKWALRGLSRTASLELGAHGVRVNAVFPGYIDTPMTASAPPAFRAASERAAALERVGRPRGGGRADRVPAVGRGVVHHRRGDRRRRWRLRPRRRQGAVGRTTAGHLRRYVASPADEPSTDGSRAGNRPRRSRARRRGARRRARARTRSAGHG